jgi:pimeloyl-ACP methyl ester carboxylesterase
MNLSLGQSDRKGMYDCKTEHIHKHEDALDEIDQWLNWLEAQGVKSITLLGHSRGGNQGAWFAAERMRPQITRVILMAPMTWDPQYTARSYAKNYGAKLAPLLEKAKSMGEGIMKSVDFIYCPKANVKASSFVSYYRDDARKNTPFLLPRIKRPVLVLVAENDKVVKNLAPKVRPLLKGSTIKMVEISEAGHMFLDFALEDAADSIAEFLE